MREPLDLDAIESRYRDEANRSYAYRDLVDLVAEVKRLQGVVALKDSDIRAAENYGQKMQRELVNLEKKVRGLEETATAALAIGEQRGASIERAAIVAWLRRMAVRGMPVSKRPFAREFADAIECGEVK